MQSSPPIEWCETAGLVDYEQAVTAMEARVAAISAGIAQEAVWLLQHPPLYTAGTSARPEDLTAPDRFPVYRAGRGGQYTYHGPGQRVAYVMLDVRKRVGDVRAFVKALEGWIIDALSQLGIKAHIREGRVGVWVPRPDLGPGREDKIAAIGIRLRKWVSFHGIAINVAPELEHFDGIVPCGIADQGVTSLLDLNAPSDMPSVDQALRSAFEQHFGRTTSAGDFLKPTSQAASLNG